MTKNDLEKLNPSVDDFAALLEESLSKINLEEGKVVTGKVSAIENDFVIVDDSILNICMLLYDLD